MENRVGENIRKVREEKRLTQKKLGTMCGKAESTIQGYENGKSDLSVGTMLLIARALTVSAGELIDGKKEEVGKGNTAELRVYNQEDRLLIGQILIKNGYTVSQGKRYKTPTGKTMEYFLRVSEDSENADTSK